MARRSEYRAAQDGNGDLPGDQGDQDGEEGPVEAAHVLVEALGGRGVGGDVLEVGHSAGDAAVEPLVGGEGDVVDAGDAVERAGDDGGAVLADVGVSRRGCGGARVGRGQVEGGGAAA